MPTVNLQPLDFCLMALYLVAIVAWGLRHSQRQSAEGYFLGGRGMRWPVIGLSMMAMCVSSSSLVGWSGDAYDTGIAVFNYGIAGAICRTRSATNLTICPTFHCLAGLC